MIMLSGGDSRCHEAYMAIADALEVPYVNWGLAPILPVDYGMSTPPPSNLFEVSIRPPTAELLADFIIYKSWTDVIYMHDGRNGKLLTMFEYNNSNFQAALNVQWIYAHIHRKTNTSVNMELMRLPRDTTDFHDFLKRFYLSRHFNDSYRWSVSGYGILSYYNKYLGDPRRYRNQFDKICKCKLIT
jgi:hypothetical protein